MIRVSVIALRTLRISGIERGDGVTIDELEGIAKVRQATYAEKYAGQRTVLGSLRANTARYNKWKAEQGFDTRKGHLTGATQAALDNAVLWTVKIRRPKGKPGTAYISFSEAKLEAEAPQYRYYRDGTRTHDGKTPQKKGVLVMTQTFAQEVQRYLRALADTMAAGRAGQKRLKEQAAQMERRRFLA